MVKKMDLIEFMEEGYLQEVNRQFLHPLGLALSLDVNADTGEAIELSVFDARDEDDYGIVFADLTSEEDRRKWKRIVDEADSRDQDRIKKFGFILQPIGSTVDEDGNVDFPGVQDE